MTIDNCDTGMPRFPAIGARARPACRITLACLFAVGLEVSASAAEDLTALSMEELLNISIVGASKYEQRPEEVGAAVAVVTRDEIRAFGWRTLAEALDSLPGVHTTYDRTYTYLGARGFGLPGDVTARLLITINGNRINDPVYDAGVAGPEFPLDMAMVERIEFLPGPGGAVYGQNAMFGVINVITRTGADLGGVEATMGFQNPQGALEGRVAWGGELENGTDLLIAISRLRADGDDLFFDYGAAGTSGVARGQDGEQDREFFASVAGGRWRFEFVYGDREKEDPTGAFFSDPLVAGQSLTDSYAIAQLNYDRTLADNSVDFAGRLFSGRYRYGDSLAYDTQFSFPAQGDWYGAELRLVTTTLESHKLMLGLEVQRNERTDQSIVDEAHPENSYELKNAGYRAGVYAQDEWRLDEGLIATLGLRVDRNDTTGTNASPRASLIWQARDDTTLKALYGRAHRAPNVYESDYEDPFSQLRNPSLQGERIDTLELVADHRFSQALALRASLYAWTMQGLITLEPDEESGLTRFEAGDDVDARGLELSFDRIWDEGVRMRGSVSFQNVESSTGAGLPNSPAMLGKVNLSGPLPWYGMRLGYEMRHVGSRLSLDGSRLRSYRLANLELSSDGIAEGLAVSLSLRNLFDERYKHTASDSNWQNAFEQDGRSVRLQIDLRF